MKDFIRNAKQTHDEKITVSADIETSTNISTDEELRRGVKVSLMPLAARGTEMHLTTIRSRRVVKCIWMETKRFCTRRGGVMIPWFNTCCFWMPIKFTLIKQPFIFTMEESLTCTNSFEIVCLNTGDLQL